MSDKKRTPSIITLIHSVREGIETGDFDPETRELGRRVLHRTERVLGHLEGAAETLERAATVQLSLLRRMVPIVEDLGELMRHSLEEARERRGVSERVHEVIDIEGDEP